MLDWIDSKRVGGVSEVTLLTPIKPGPIPGERRTYEQRLERALQLVQERLDMGVPTPIGLMPTIHYARWLILRPRQYLEYSGCAPKPVRLAEGGKLPDWPHGHRSWLFFTSNFDGDMKSYLRDFSVKLGEDVDKIWGNCEGYPPGGSRDFDAYWDYAKRHQILTNAFYNAYPGLTVPEIHRLRVFKQRFDAFVAATRDADGHSVDGIGQAFDRFLCENQAYAKDFPSQGGIYAKDQ